MNRPARGTGFATMAACVLSLLPPLVIAPKLLLAAEIRIVQTGSPLTLIVVRGEIENGDAERFASVTEDLGLGAVLFESPGGDLIDGLNIGRKIREAGYSTGVAPQTACASACALAWLAGSTRYMDPTALVGFHAAYSEANGVVSESGVGNALVGAYLNQLGLGTDAVIFATSAAPDQMNWLNAAQARRAGIEVVLLAAEGSETTIAPEVGLQLPPGFRWIVIESGASPDDLKMANRADQIVRTRNGFYAAVLGPFAKDVAEAGLNSDTSLPPDSYLSSGNGFLFVLDR